MIFLAELTTHIETKQKIKLVLTADIIECNKNHKKYEDKYE